MQIEKPGIDIPLVETGNGAGYELSDIKKSVKFNMKNIILTNPGERVMDADFGVGVMRLLFENEQSDLFEDIYDRIEKQISTYAPYVTLLNLQIRPGDQTIFIAIKYEIDFAEIVDSLELELSNTNANNLI